MKRRNAQILSILLSLCVLGTSPVYAEDFSSDTITTEAESQNMASDEAASDAEFSVEEDGNPATDKNPTTDKNPSTDKDPSTDEDPATDTDPASEADVTLEEEETGNQEEANSDEFVDDQEETFSDGDSETEFDEEEEDVQNVAGPLTENEEDAVGSGTLLEADIPASDSVKTSCNYYTGMNLEAQDYYIRSSTVNSYLTQSPDGGLMRVQAGAIDSQTLLIEYYDKQYNLQKTMTLQLSLPIFGAFYEDDNNYYILTGAKNKEKDNTKEVYRLTKYSKDWKAQGSCGLFGANTTIPFDAGSARMARYGKYIFVRTCHEMYSGHQANVTFSVDTSNMSVIEGITGVVDGVGYVSHSFNQFIQVDNGTLVGSDHGDAYPRALVVLKYPTDLSKGNFVPSYSNKCKKYTMLDIPGRTGANYTGVSQGGFEYSDSSYLVAGNSDTNGEDSARNVFISSIPKDGGAATVRYFSNYAGTEDSAATPQLVKTGSNSFVLLWSSRGYVYYTAVDGSGQQVGSTHKMAGNLSDCVPTIADGKLIWYGWRNKNTVFYDISLSDLYVNHAVRIQNGHRYKYGAVAVDGHVDETCSVCGDTEQLAVPTSVNYTFLFLDNAYVHMRDSMFLKSGNEYRLMWDYKFKNTSLKKISDLKITSSDPSVLQVEEEYSGSEWAWIKALKSGKATLTVQDKYNPEAKCSSEIYVDILEEPAVYVTFGDRYANYDGTEHSVNVNMFSDMFKMEEGTDYQVTYDGDRVNAGTVKVTVTGIGKYSGTTTGEMVINPIYVMNSQVSASIAADKYQYDGKEKKPGMVMSYKGMSLKEGKDYTLSYSNNVQPGTATVTVTGIGNYTGTLYRSFLIEGKPSEPVINPTKPSQGTVTNPAAKPSSTTKVTPKPTAKPKSTAKPKPTATPKPKAVKAPANTSSLSVRSKAKGKATVSWKAVKGITSYQVQYSNYKNMKKAKTVTLKSRSKSTTLKKLKRKKYCYVRIRTVKKVGKKNYYSKWSKVRSVKVK